MEGDDLHALFSTTQSLDMHRWYLSWAWTGMIYFLEMAWAKSTRKIQHTKKIQHMIPTKRCMHGKSGVIQQMNKNQGLDRDISYVAQPGGPHIEIKYHFNQLKSLKRLIFAPICLTAKHCGWLDEAL
jgi:hypothetical protein